APKDAGQDKVNPGSLLLSGVLMFEHLGWQQAPDDGAGAREPTIADKIVTYDFARLMDGATEVKTSEFAGAIVDRLYPPPLAAVPSRLSSVSTFVSEGGLAVKITVVGCGFYGSTLVQRIAEA